MSDPQLTLEQRIFQLDMELLRNRIAEARPNMASIIVDVIPDCDDESDDDDSNEDGLTLYLYGDAAEEGWDYWTGVYSPKTVRDFLAQADGADVTIRINSPGGVAYTGSAIYNTLKAYKGKVTTIVDGFCGSAASLVFLGGERRIMNLGTELMIHSPWMITAGNHAELKKAAERMENLSNVYAEVYAEESNQTQDEAKAAMDAETYMVGEQAVELGYATEVGKAQTDPKPDGEKARLARMAARTELMREIDLMRIKGIISR